MACLTGWGRHAEGPHLQSGRRPGEYAQPERAARFHRAAAGRTPCPRPRRNAARRSALVCVGYASVARSDGMAAEGRALRGPAHTLALARPALPPAASGRGSRLMRVVLINPHWHYEGSIYFGCRSPHLPLELGIAQHLLREAGHETLLIDAHMFALSGDELADELQAFAPDMAVITTAPTYLF